MDLPSTRALLGVSDSAPRNFSACSSAVGQAFSSHMDKWAVHTQDYIANLLDRGVRVLIYAGTYDWQCNYVANKMWVEKLQWHGSALYTSSEWRDWSLDTGLGGSSPKVGEVKETPLLSFVTIRGAGHMIRILSIIFCKIGILTSFLFAFTSRMTNQQRHWRWFQGGWPKRKCREEYLMKQL